MSSATTLTAVGISGSPSSTSRSRTLVEAVLSRLAGNGAMTRLIDLSTLNAEALLVRSKDAGVDEAIAAAAGARIIVAGTPIYRATYTGLLKCFFDLLPPDGLVGTVGVPVATGGSTAHLLMIDHGMRPLFASLGGLTTATTIYATSADFDDQTPGEGLSAQLDRVAAEALALAQALPAKAMV